MKPFVAMAVLALSLVARADAPKSAATPRKLPPEARAYVADKDVPSLDKTVAIARVPRPASKDK